MRILIPKCETLSAVLRAMTKAHSLHEEGHTVFVSALPRFHDLFRCVEYCKPVNPFVTPPAVDETVEGVVDDQFDSPPLSHGAWFDVDHYHIDDRPVVSVYGVGFDPDCAATEERVLADAQVKLAGRPYYVLTQDQNFWNDGRHVSPLRLRDLPGLIAYASEFWAPDSTALNIAYAVRPLQSTFRLAHEEMVSSQ